MSSPSSSRRTSGVSAARVLGLPVSRVADQVEAAVELDVDLAAVGLGDLDLVIALLVANLGLGDGAAAGRPERDRARFLERFAGDRLGVLAAGCAGDPGAANDPNGGADVWIEVPAA